MIESNRVIVDIIPDPVRESVVRQLGGDSIENARADILSEAIDTSRHPSQHIPGGPKPWHVALAPPPEPPQPLHTIDKVLATDLHEREINEGL